MKAEFSYSDDEVRQIVLAQHTLRFAPPAGMKWAMTINVYGSRVVKIEAVDDDGNIEKAEGDAA